MTKQLKSMEVRHIGKTYGSEHQEQCAVIDYCKLRNYSVFAIPNGGTRNVREAMNLKREGVSPGVPDLFIPIAVQPHHGLFIEMKVGRNKTSPGQDEWIALLRRNGYAVSICYGADIAIESIEKYLNKKELT